MPTWRRCCASVHGRRARTCTARRQCGGGGGAGDRGGSVAGGHAAGGEDLGIHGHELGQRGWGRMGGEGGWQAAECGPVGKESEVEVPRGLLRGVCEWRGEGGFGDGRGDGPVILPFPGACEATRSRSFAVRNPRAFLGECIRRRCML
jgi:hypothetical protein